MRQANREEEEEEEEEEEREAYLGELPIVLISIDRESEMGLGVQDREEGVDREEV